MKKVSKLIALAFTVTAIFFSADVSAQKTLANTFTLSIGADAGILTGKITPFENTVVGGTANIQYGVSDNFDLTLTSGGDHFLPGYIPGTNTRYPSFGVIPIKVGAKVFFVQNFYFTAEIGVAIEETDSGVGNKKFALAPGVGWANRHWDLGVRYENYSGQSDPYGFVALRVAYGFKL